MKVLIVEDSPPMVKMIRRTIAAFTKSAKRIALYAAELPDLWTSLGAVNGIAATGQIKTVSRSCRDSHQLQRPRNARSRRPRRLRYLKIEKTRDAKTFDRYAAKKFD